MSTGPTLPAAEKEALLRELRELYAGGKGISQGALGSKIGMTQGAVNRAIKHGHVGRDFARAFYDAFGIKDPRTLIRKHGTSGPAPHGDMSAREFLQWVKRNHAVTTLTKDREITVLDLLRVHRTPPRHGEADPDELKKHILQLRRGDVGEIPGIDIAARDLEAQMRDAYATKR